MMGSWNRYSVTIDNALALECEIKWYSGRWQYWSVNEIEGVALVRHSVDSYSVLPFFSKAISAKIRDDHCPEIASLVLDTWDNTRGVSFMFLRKLSGHD
jgi:hypothetical protein